MSAPSVYRSGLGAYARSPQFAALVERLDLHKVLKPSTSENAVNGGLQEESDSNEVAISQSKPRKSFNMHIGAALTLPTDDNRYKPVSAEVRAAANSGRLVTYDPFEGIPLRRFAESLGARFEPVAQAIKEDHKRKQAEAIKGVEQAIASSDTDATVASLPAYLPITRWAAGNTTVRETLVADDPKTMKRPRMSWYHPDDTMVPRDWFRGGLMADLAYYNPFNLGRSVGSQEQQAQK